MGLKFASEMMKKFWKLTVVMVAHYKCNVTELYSENGQTGTVYMF